MSKFTYTQQMLNAEQKNDHPAQSTLKTFRKKDNNTDI